MKRETEDQPDLPDGKLAGKVEARKETLRKSLSLSGAELCEVIVDKEGSDGFYDGNVLNMDSFDTIV